jgi:hypothetical protein
MSNPPASPVWNSGGNSITLQALRRFAMVMSCFVTISELWAMRRYPHRGMEGNAASEACGQGITEITQLFVSA